MQNITKLLNISPRKIIISGDSAGGFLSLNLMNFLIRHATLRIPDAILLIYPCLRVYFREMCPSDLLCLTDCFVDTPFLSQLMDITLDIDSYYNRTLVLDDRYNFFLTPSEIIKQYPSTYIVVGSNDPLRDECYLLTDLLIKNSEYLYYSHGFMYLTTFVDKYYCEGLNQMKDYIKSVFYFCKD